MSRNLLFSEYPMFDRIMEERPDLCRRVLETALGYPWTRYATSSPSGSVVLGHGFKWVVLNASAWEMLPDGPLRGLLRYVATEEVGGDGLTADLAAAVEAANEDAPWREESLVMLTLEEDMRAQGRLLQKKGREEGLAEGRAEGRAAGRAEGADQLGKLIAQLMDAGRFEDARRAATDAEYRERLLEELDS